MMEPSKQKLITEEQIAQRVNEIAAEINRNQEGRELVAICILKGSILFFSDLIRKFDFPVVCEFIRVEMGESSHNELIRTIRYSVDFEVVGKDLLLVEDILDTGITLDYLVDYFLGKHANSVRTCALLNKKENRKTDVRLDFSGFDIPNKFVVGYGLDHEEHYRQLPYITTIDGATWPLAEQEKNKQE